MTFVAGELKFVAGDEMAAILIEEHRARIGRVRL